MRGMQKLAAAVVPLVVLMTGCGDSGPPPIPAAPQPQPAAVTTTNAPAVAAPTVATVAAPTAATVAAPQKVVKFNPADLELYVVKDGKAFVQLNLYPEADALRGLDAAARETYLYRRVAKSLLEKGLDHKAFAGKDEFVVRMVMLKSMDEYGRPKWGEAADIGRLIATRAAVEKHTGKTADTLSADDVAAMFSERRIAADSLNTFLR